MLSSFRKHPEVLALTAICFALFVNIGVQRTIERFEGGLLQQHKQEVFKVRQLVVTELREQGPALRDGLTVLRDSLRSLKP